MNWDYTGAQSYVDAIPPSPFLSPHSAYDRSPFGPDARLKPENLRQPCSSEQLRPNVQHFGVTPAHGAAPGYPGPVIPSPRPPLLRTVSLPPVELSKQLASTPEIPHSVQSPASSQNTPGIPQSAFTPPNSAAAPGRPTVVIPRNTNMADPRRAVNPQRPLMGPPETPSRAMQASPNMFPTLQFSPDLFAGHSMGPATAPAYPQQRLFWDQTSMQPEMHPPEQFQSPFQDTFDASFHSSSTVVPNYSPVVSPEAAFELPSQRLPPGPFLDTTAFPMPFQTSPRPPPPAVENPTQFLSSPARRFGGHDIPTTTSFNRPAREVPAYHHQIEEARREREVERRRNKHAAKRADADLIMSSVRRALSPSKSIRPGVKRSQTYSGLSSQQKLRRPSRVSFNDSASTSSAASGDSSRNERATPFKATRQISSSSLSRSRTSQKARTAMSLAIDENGVAKTVLQQLPESDNDMDLDEDSQSVISSADDEDFNIIHSQANSFAVDDDSGMAYPQRQASHSGRMSDSGRVIGRVSQDGRGTIAPSGGRGFVSAGKGDAQKALRAIIEDRSRSVSAQGGYTSSRQSDSSVQFHSSPPVHQNQFGEFNASPTTITDPDLATPSTDQDSYASIGATRCICNSASPDGSAMIQCDACSKWLHSNCIGVDKRRTSDVYICVYCEQTPVRHPANRGSVRSSMRAPGNSASPLAHKSVRPNRGR